MLYKYYAQNNDNVRLFAMPSSSDLAIGWVGTASESGIDLTDV